MKVILNSISKNFGSKNILKDINLEIAENSFTVLKGVSGSGKSTLMNIIGGIESPTSGNIIIDNQNINNLRRKDRVNFYRKKNWLYFSGILFTTTINHQRQYSINGNFRRHIKT